MLFIKKTKTLKESLSFGEKNKDTPKTFVWKGLTFHSETSQIQYILFGKCSVLSLHIFQMWPEFKCIILYEDTDSDLALITLSVKSNLVRFNVSSHHSYCKKWNHLFFKVMTWDFCVQADEPNVSLAETHDWILLITLIIYYPSVQEKYCLQVFKSLEVFRWGWFVCLIGVS